MIHITVRSFRPLCAVPLLVLAMAAGGCMTRSPETPDARVLLEADRNFSAMSEREGSVRAFLEYMAEEGKVLPRQAPPEGRDLFSRLIGTDDEDTSTVLTWEPLHADIAASGDLGYTWGRYTQAAVGENGVPKRSQGYYVTVWKKQADGSWKFVFDTGNQLPDKSDDARR